MRILIFLYGLVSYVLFLGVFLYAIGFVGGVAVPKALNDGDVGSLATAMMINAGLLAVFGIQHTIMARPAFKRWWTRFVPESIERATFVLATVVILTWLIAQWQALPGVIWELEGVAAGVMTALSLAGWGVVLISTFLIDHFELFGLKQTFAYATGRTIPQAQFRERWFYRYVRHPLMVGFLIAFWFTPVMTVGHLLFASISTGYILVALIVEERTLIGLHGDAYRGYQRRVPKLIPRLTAARGGATENEE
jgi:protein-S-isoprenylcysteine O-methyltransferase Ste14